jgi:hypothetical protein
MSIARIEKVFSDVYPVLSAVLNGSASQDPDGRLTLYGWCILYPLDSVAFLENPGSDVSKLSDLVLGSYVIELMIEDNNFATASNKLQLIVVGEAKVLQVFRQPPAYSTAGPLVAQLIVSIHDEIGCLENAHALRISASLLEQRSSSIYHFTLAFSQIWQGHIPFVPTAGYESFPELVVLRSGWFVVHVSVASLESATSDVLKMILGPATLLQILGLDKGCYLQEHIQNQRIGIWALHSVGNTANVSNFMLLASILGSSIRLTVLRGSKATHWTSIVGDQLDFQLVCSIRPDCFR